MTAVASIQAHVIQLGQATLAECPPSPTLIIGWDGCCKTRLATHFFSSGASFVIKNFRHTSNQCQQTESWHF